MAGGGGGEEGEFGLQIAPMLDVMFVLLLFFMVSAGAVVKEAELGIKVPATSKGPSNPVADAMPIIIKIEGDGSVLFNNAMIDTPDSEELPMLKDRLKALVASFSDQNTPVIISPSGEAIHRRVVNVLNACSYAAVKNVIFRKLN